MNKKSLVHALNQIVAVEGKDNKYEIKLLKTIMAYLEMSYLFYQSAHWQTKGSDFYGDHLLFQRLYEGIRDEIDTVGEKMVGVYGPEHVDVHRRLSNLSILSDFLDLQYIQKEYVNTGLVMEKKLLDLLQEADKSTFSAGVKDLLAGIANTHEGHMYLLQQRQLVS
jgi:DNA-binding ferritin-like protein